MSFFETLGNIRADLQMPLARRQLQSRYDLENQQIEEALNQAVALGQKQGEAPDTFSEADKLKYHQQLKRAGVDPVAMAQADRYWAQAQQEALRTRGLEESLEQIDNPYAQANIANKLDVSPVRMSGQTAYNRFDADNWQVGTTARGQAEAVSALQDVHEKNIQLEVLQDVIDDPLMPFSKKLDYMSGKEISDSERIATIDPETGEKVYATRYWTPSGYKIKKDTDTEGSYVSIPADETTYAKQRDIENLVAANYDRAEATRIVLGKDRSSLAIYDEISKALQTGTQYAPPVSDPFQLQVESIKTYANRRPGQRLPNGLEQTLKLHNFTEEQEKELQELINNVNTIADLVSGNDQIQAEGDEAELNNPPPAAITANTLPELPEIPQTQPVQQQQPQPQTQPVQQQQPQPQTQPVQQQQPQPLTPEVMNAAYQAFTDGASPEDIRQRLEDSGFDMSPETIGVMAIDAINQGADPQQVAERFKALWVMT